MTTTYTAKNSTSRSDSNGTIREYTVTVASSRGTIRRVVIRTEADTGTVLNATTRTEDGNIAHKAPKGYKDAALGYLGL